MSSAPLTGHPDGNRNYCLDGMSRRTVGQSRVDLAVQRRTQGREQ